MHIALPARYPDKVSRTISEICIYRIDFSEKNLCIFDVFLCFLIEIQKEFLPRKFSHDRLQSHGVSVSRQFCRASRFLGYAGDCIVALRRWQNKFLALGGLWFFRRELSYWTKASGRSAFI